MSYKQAMKHWHNHRKDRFYQQCSCDIYSSKEWTFAIIDSETKEIISNEFKTKKEAEHAEHELHKLYPKIFTHIIDVCGGRPIIV